VPQYSALARVFAEMKGDKERAAQLCRQALDLEPGNQKALTLLASLGATRG